jgi:hypothetical protein
MNPEEYREFLKNSDVKLAIPISRCQETLELLISEIARRQSEQEMYLRAFYTARAQRLLQSMIAQLPEIEAYFRNQGNIFVLALLDEKLEPYEVVNKP